VRIGLSNFAREPVRRVEGTTHDEHRSMGRRNRQRTASKDDTGRQGKKERKRRSVQLHVPPTPTHTHAHIRREDGSALYYIKMGSSEMAIDIIWNLRFDKTGNVCAMRCSDVSEVRRRKMQCFSAGYLREVSVLQCQRFPRDGRRV
jgi:hypothetical protein